MTFFKALSGIQITTAATCALIELQSSVAIIIILMIIIIHSFVCDDSCSKM